MTQEHRVTADFWFVMCTIDLRYFSISTNSPSLTAIVVIYIYVLHFVLLMIVINEKFPYIH